MNILSSIPQITVLKERVEQSLDFPLSTHGDFQRLSFLIGTRIHEPISESTLERVWGYSTRHYDTISIRTLNVLSRFIGVPSWEEFCEGLCENGSELFNAEIVSTADLQIGTRIKLGWCPDRICIIRYLGKNRFIAESTENSIMQPGDSFSCQQFIVGKEAQLTNFSKKDSCDRFNYFIGTQSGITTLEIL